jgi:hypothetical protein
LESWLNKKNQIRAVSFTFHLAENGLLKTGEKRKVHDTNSEISKGVSLIFVDH